MPVSQCATEGRCLTYAYNALLVQEYSNNPAGCAEACADDNTIKLSWYTSANGGTCFCAKGCSNFVATVGFTMYKMNGVR